LREVAAAPCTDVVVPHTEAPALKRQEQIVNTLKCPPAEQAARETTVPKHFRLRIKSNFANRTLT
jgi:hypothetical protein